MDAIELQDVLARIRRAQAETDRIVDEGRKLRAEAGKLERERTTMLITTGAALAGAAGVLGGVIVKLVGG